MAQSCNIDNSQLISLIISYMCGGLCLDNNLQLAWRAVFLGSLLLLSMNNGGVGGPGSRRHKRPADMLLMMLIIKEGNIYCMVMV